MGLIVLVLGYGSLFVDSYTRVLAMGVLLGIAGASFGVALSLGGGWYPPKLKGLAMGIAGAGDSGTVLAVLATLMNAVARMVGGQVADRIGGINVPTTTAVVVSMIGEAGAFGGGFIPNAMVSRSTARAPASGASSPSRWCRRRCWRCCASCRADGRTPG